MHLLLVGVSHRTAPVDLRERIDFSTRGVDAAVASLAARATNSEAAVVSTCNRAEVYVACDDPTAARSDRHETRGERNPRAHQRANRKSERASRQPGEGPG